MGEDERQFDEQNTQLLHTVFDKFEKFFLHLALFSGGSVALSITYLGYLTGRSGAPVYLPVLYVSWVLLTLCVMCSLFVVYLKALFLENLWRLKRDSARGHDAVISKENQTYTKELKESFEFYRRTDRFLFTPIAILSYPVALILLILFAVLNTASKRSQSPHPFPNPPVLAPVPNCSNAPNATPSSSLPPNRRH